MGYIFSIFSFNSVEESDWKYRNGYYIGDGLSFHNDYFKIKNDTIFINRAPKAIFNKIELRASDRLLIIRQINGEELGYYCSK